MNFQFYTLYLGGILNNSLFVNPVNIVRAIKVGSVSGDISGESATLYIRRHHLSLSGICVIAG